ncbi:MAG: hypothetical protein WCW26_02515 [Candidatus Buchananbacteria bacterium]
MAVNKTKIRHLVLGFSLVEIILAVGLFGLFATALLGLLMDSYGSNFLAAEKNQATLYAQQGIDATLSIRRQAWNLLINGDHSLTNNLGHWEFSGTADLLVDKYNRVVSISNICRDGSNNIVDCTQAGASLDLYTKKAVCKVSYTSINHIPNNIELVTYLTNWQSRDWFSTNWFLGSGQSYWSNASKYDSDDGNIDYATAGEIKLAQTAGLKNQNWNLDIETDYVYDPNKIEIINGIAWLKSLGVEYSDQSQNAGFDSSSGWSFSWWDQDWGEVWPSGSRRSSGGNPGGYYRLIVPRSKNNLVGGWTERSFTVSQSNLSSVKLNFDWRVEQKSGAVPNTFRLYVFIDKNAGVEPVIGNQVWASPELKSLSPIPSIWNNVTNIDVSSAVSGPGTYYLKLAVWVETPNQNSGQFTVGYDNAKVVWSWNGAGYPTDKPTIEPAASFTANQLQNWHGFSEQASKNGGEIYYQLSNDNGSTWRYWNGSTWAAAGATNYNTATQINAHFKDFLIDPNNFKFKAFLVSSGTQLVGLDAVGVYYATAEGKYWGNEFLVTQLGQTGDIDDSNKKVSLRFTARQSKLVNQIRVYQASTSGLGTFRVGLQADNGSGQPSGTYLASGTYLNILNGWQSVTISPNIALVKDKIYHIVISRQSGSTKAYRFSLPQNNFWTYDNLADPNLNVLWTTNGGTTWSVLAKTPIFVLRYTDNTFNGMPCHNFITDNNSYSRIYGNRQRGQSFIYSGDDLEVSGASFYVRKRSASAPEDDLYVSLYSLSDNLELASSTLATASQITDSYSWQTANFAKTKILTNGKEYRISLYSPLTSSNLAYDIYVMENTNNSVYNNLNYLGTEARYSLTNNGGNSWNYYNQYDSAFRLIYYPTSTGYAPFGFFLSSAFDTGSPSSFNILSWDQIIPACSPACEIKLQLRTAPDAGGFPGSWTDWFGQTGSGSYFTNPTGTLLPLNLNFNQWVQYRVELTGDGNNTPVLNQIKINYTP